MQISIKEALNQLDCSKALLFTKVLEHGTMSVEIYRPVKTDLQTPHKQDELYVVISGCGEFINGDTCSPFGKGDVLFVPAGTGHRFVNFTDDFATWVIFYGPEDGEK